MKTPSLGLATLFALGLTVATGMAATPFSGGCLGGTTNLDDKAATSLTCLQCHDGAVARGGAMPAAAAGPTVGPRSHPVMISYAQVCLEKPTKFNTVSAVSGRLHLRENQVDCVTCHTYSPDGRWHQALSNQRSALCLTCHRK